MGIDGIGKPGPVGPPGGVGGVGGVSGVSGPATTGETFKVEAPGTTEKVKSSEALGALQRGEIGLDQYLDHRADEAVRHLAGKLPGEEIDFIRETVRQTLATDPVLMELVRRTTGSAPTEASETD